MATRETFGMASLSSICSPRTSVFPACQTSIRMSIALQMGRFARSLPTKVKSMLPLQRPRSFFLRSLTSAERTSFSAALPVSALRRAHSVQLLSLVSLCKWRFSTSSMLVRGRAGHPLDISHKGRPAWVNTRGISTARRYMS